MAKGEKTFNTASVEKKRRSFEPFPAGEYDLKILADTVQIRRAEPSERNPNPVSYVSLALEALGSSKEEGGRNRRVFHNFFCKLAPGKDGLVGPTMVDQIKGFADALGVHLQVRITEEAGQEVLSQLDVKKFIESHDGDIVRAHVGIQKGTKDFPGDRNTIKEFLETEESTPTKGKKAAPIEEDEDEEDEDEDEDEDFDDEDEDEDEDDLPPPPSKKVKSGKKRR